MTLKLSFWQSIYIFEGLKRRQVKKCAFTVLLPWESKKTQMVSVDLLILEGEVGSLNSGASSNTR